MRHTLGFLGALGRGGCGGRLDEHEFADDFIGEGEAGGGEGEAVVAELEEVAVEEGGDGEVEGGERS